MPFRVVFARFLIRLGRFIQSLALMVMRPGDLIEFGRQTYAKPQSIEGWSRQNVWDSGLSPEETELLETVPLKKGRLLLLGVGGGREAISLGRFGFEVTGVDYIPELVANAKKNAAQCGVNIDGIVQEISNLDTPANVYDIVWLSAAMYSCIPTRQRRINMLKRIGHTLAKDGYFICQFHWDTRDGFSSSVELARKAVAFLTQGNLCYEKGDLLWGNAEFLHAFSRKDELESEFEAGGFEVIYISVSDEDMAGGAVLKLSPHFS